MECNKEEAFRAKELAEKKMQDGDFVGAQRIALKAQKLYPDLDNISQLLMVCEVHCSAQNKINGSEMDWYGILQIEKFSDESVVRKQFRKLALSLHPDKNKFAGAEAAFKLIGEANRVLLDPAKRPAYDLKCRAAFRSVASKPPSDQSNKKYSFVKKDHVAANKFSNAPHTQYTSSRAFKPPQQTFWTSCPYCHVRFEYYRQFLKNMLRCQNCQQPFIAHDLVIPPGSTRNQFFYEKRVSNQCASEVMQQNYARNPSGMGFSHGLSGSDSMPKVEGAANISESKHRELKSENVAGIGGGSKLQEEVNGRADVKAGNVGVSVSMPDAMKPKESGTSKSTSNKRCRKSVEESSNNFERRNKAGSEENVTKMENGSGFSAQNSGSSSGLQSRRSSRLKQYVPCKENLSDDDDFVTFPPKRSRGNNSCSGTDGGMKEAIFDGGTAKEGLSADFAASAVNRNSKELKQKASSSLEEVSSNKKSKTGNSKAKVEETSKSERVGIRSENIDERSKADTYDLDPVEAQKPQVFICADPDFSNFERDRAESSFAVNQVWAIYDTCDGMPRFYARIKKVFTPGFKLQITWLEASPNEKFEQQWYDEELPIGCGRYEDGDIEETEDRMMFSHEMKCMNGRQRGTYMIYPKMGETWALFKGWDVEWCLEPEKHRSAYQFEFVEVLTDFSKDIGIGVAYLGKVEGFVSIFQQAHCNEVLKFCVKPDELFRFSHRVPSVRMSGEEREGVPAGSFEFDTAALPSNFASLVDTENICIFKNIECGPERGTSTVRSYPKESTETCKDDNQVDTGQQGKEEVSGKVASWCHLTQPVGINISFQANEKISIHKKREEGKFVAVSLTPRRSPRDLSKRSSQMNASQITTKGINKHMATNRDCRDGQPDASSCQPDDKMHLRSKDGRFISPVKGPSSTGRKVVEFENYDFKKERSEDKFKLKQIWSVSRDRDAVPRNYVQVKKIESTTDFKLHVAMLEACMLQKDASRPASCGIFRVKSGKPVVLPVSAFSHQVNAKPMGPNTYEIYPRQGEIWAVYRRWNAERTCVDQGAGECDIVEVVEDNSGGVKVVLLMPVKGHDTVYRCLASKRARSIMDIPRVEFYKFSHQCLAHQLVEENDNPLKHCWQVDPLSIPGGVIVVE